ncbi:MAG: hypothetical protein Kow0088_08220 [Anaerolineales bacterium]
MARQAGEAVPHRLAGFEYLPLTYPGEMTFHPTDLSHNRPIHIVIEQGTGLDAPFLNMSMSLVDGFCLQKVSGNPSKARFLSGANKRAMS